MSAFLSRTKKTILHFKLTYVIKLKGIDLETMLLTYAIHFLEYKKNYR